MRRDATDILAAQDRALRQPQAKSEVEASLLEIKEIGEKIGAAFRATDFDRFGALMHEHWLAKKRLSRDVTVEPMERLYEVLRERYGVTGGKVAGAGGGGFMMLYCPSGGSALTEHMATLGFERLSWNVDFAGTRVVSNLLATRSVKRHR